MTAAERWDINELLRKQGGTGAAGGTQGCKLHSKQRSTQGPSVCSVTYQHHSTNGSGSHISHVLLSHFEDRKKVKPIIVLGNSWCVQPNTGIGTLERRQTSPDFIPSRRDAEIGNQGVQVQENSYMSSLCLSSKPGQAAPLA